MLVYLLQGFKDFPQSEKQKGTESALVFGEGTPFIGVSVNVPQTQLGQIRESNSFCKRVYCFPIQNWIV